MQKYGYATVVAMLEKERIEGEHIRIEWNSDSISIEELPTRNSQRVRTLTGNIWPTARNQCSILLWVNVVEDAGLNENMSFDEAYTALAKSVEKYSQQAIEDGVSKDARPITLNAPFEVSRNKVAPAGHADKIVAKAKDFTLTSTWSEWRSYDPKSNFEAADPSYTLLVSKHATSARRMYRTLRENPNALADVSWDGFTKWLDDNDMAYDYRFSSWH